jgi:hypothetical protein
MDEWETYCIHAEHLESSTHASWKVFLDTLTVIFGQSRAEPIDLEIMRFDENFRAKRFG